jgi:hypothetical protein
VSTATATPSTWGRYRTDATRELPEVEWHVLTDPQVDSLYLTLRGVSQRGVALMYQVSQPAVAKHLRKARERLSTTLPLESDRQPVSPRLCAECDTPALPCRRCPEQTMSAAPVLVANGRGGCRVPVAP